MSHGDVLLAILERERLLRLQHDEREAMLIRIRPRTAIVIRRADATMEHSKGLLAPSQARLDHRGKQR